MDNTIRQVKFSIYLKESFEMSHILAYPHYIFANNKIRDYNLMKHHAFYIKKTCYSDKPLVYKTN